MWDSSNPRLLRLKRWYLRINSRFQLKPPQEKEEEAPASPDTSETGELENQLFSQQGITRDITRDPNLEALKGLKVPWEIGANFAYSYNWDEVNKGTKNFDLNIDGSIQLTKNWRIQYYATYDLIKRNIDYQRFIIYRDLHCWEMSLEWAPNPNFSYYRLEIRVKESALHDIKLTKTANNRPVF